MSEMFGAPAGILAGEESGRQNMLAGVQAQKLLGDIAMQPAEMGYKQSLARLHSAEALAKEQEAVDQQQMLDMQKKFLVQGQAQLTDAARAQGREATVEDLNGKGQPRSQADDLRAFADFAAANGAPPLALAKTRKLITEITEKEAIGADHASRAVTQAWNQQKTRVGLVSNIAGAAAESPQNYLTILADPKNRELLPKELTGDWATDAPVLRAISAAGQDAIRRGELELKAVEAEGRAQRRRVQEEKDAANIALAEERTRRTRLLANDLEKYGGPGSRATQNSRKEMTDAQKAANAARDAKEHPPLILDPNSRIPGQKYKLADGRIARWEVNPATGKYGLNVLSAAQIGQAPVVAPKASVAADSADDEDLED